MKVNIKQTGLAYEYSDLSSRSSTDQIVIHHTGNPKDDDCSAWELNESHKAQGWACIGYHYVIRKDGTIEEGRPHWTVGAHAYGENSHTIGIHVCGNFENAELTAPQIEALSMLVGKLCEDYGLPVTDKYVVGHCDLMATACPGRNLYHMLDTIRGKAIWYQHNQK